MTRNKILAKRVNEVLIDGHWIANTNYKEQIMSVSWDQATYKIGSLNTIAALTFHINYYLDGIINVFDGGVLEIKDQYSFDIPPIESELAWKKLVDSFIINSEKFIKHVQQMPDNKLDETFVDIKYGSYLRNIEGFIEHCYYHLGQISLIKILIVKNTY
jgi:hypothetical protein